uniref:Uncharacterized protein n=1 Tax=Anguilla anguilla TaxID=7936 RepID=A0A0E9REA6_ANGAN
METDLRLRPSSGTFWRHLFLPSSCSYGILRLNSKYKIDQIN